MKRKLLIFKIVFLSLFFLFFFLLFFSLYKLGVLFGPTLVLTIVGAGLLLFTIAYCLAQASDRLIVKRKPKIAFFFDDELRAWAQRQYFLINGYLSCGLLSSLALTFLGMRTIWVHLTHPVIGALDMVISTFGLIIICLGVSFSVIFIKEFVFMRNNKKKIIEKIFEQVKDDRAGIQQFPQK